MMICNKMKMKRFLTSKLLTKIGSLKENNLELEEQLSCG